MALELGKTAIPGESFEEAALVHLDYINRVALKWTGNEEDAHDLVQETFFRAFRFFDRYEPGSNCKAWLCRILKNALINNHRKQQRRPVVNFEAIDGIGESQVQSPGLRLGNPEETLLNSTLKEDVRRAFASLPPRYREALSLSLVDGFSYREIARMLGCPIGTVMSRIHRARKLTQSGLRHHSDGMPRAAAQVQGACPRAATDLSSSSRRFPRFAGPGSAPRIPSSPTISASGPDPAFIPMSVHGMNGADGAPNLRRAGENARN